MENGEVMGALKDIGRTDLLEKVQKNIAEAIRQYGEEWPSGAPASFRRAQKLGTVGHDYLEENRHVQPKAAADADTGIRAADMVGIRLAKALNDLKDWTAEHEGGNRK